MVNVIEEFIKNYAIIIIPIILFLFWYFVWRNLDFLTKKKVREFFSGVRLLVFLFFLIWFLWHRYGVDIMVKRSDPWMIVIGWLITFIYLGFFNLRYKTKQIVGPNFHGSFAKRWEKNGFYIYSIGSIDYGIKLEHAQDILVVRKETVADFGKGQCELTISRASPVSIYSLPRAIKELIDDTPSLKRARNKISYGWFHNIHEIDWTPEQLEILETQKTSTGKFKDPVYNYLRMQLGVENPSIKLLYQLFLDANKGWNKASEILDATIEDVEKGVEHNKRVRDVYSERKPEKMEGYEES